MVRQLDSSRFQPTCIFRAYLPYGLHPGVLVWAIHDNHSQNQGSSISRTHTTILVHARTSHCKFGRIWKRFRDHLIITKLRTITNVMDKDWKPTDHYFNKEPWCPQGYRDCIYAYQYEGTASMCISISLGKGLHSVDRTLYRLPKVIFQQRAQVSHIF